MKRVATAMMALCLWAGCGDDAATTSGGPGGGGGGSTSQGGSGGEGGTGGSDACAALGEQLQAALDASLASEARLGGTVGAVRTPSCRWTGAAGESDTGTKLLPTALMRVGSVTKTYLAATLLTLAEEGALSLDDTLDSYVPGVPNGDTITVRQLLQHTAGVYNYTNDGAFMTQMVQNPMPVEPQVMVDVAIAHGADFPPGSDWNYSNTGYILLGMILEQAAGAGAAETMRARMLDAQGLERTFFDGDEPLPEPLAKGWGAGQADHTNLLHPSVPWTAGSMVAEVGDLVDWADALYDGDAISAAALAQMLDAYDFGNGGGYGLGVEMGTSASAGRYVGHSGGIPGFLTLMYYFEDSDVAVATVVNNELGDPSVAFAALVQVAVAAP